MTPSAHACLEPSRDGSVLLDIGGEVGALVLYVSEERLGEELELRPLDGSPRVHSQVRLRNLAAKVLLAAVFPQLRAGWYELECNGQPIYVAAGHVCEVTLPNAGVRSAE